MGHDAFAHHGLGSAALVIIDALHARPAQSVGELLGSSSVSRATAYRTLRRLADHGLVHHSAETWSLAPRALEGLGKGLLDAAIDEITEPAQGWESVAKRHGTTSVAARRKALHAAERAATGMLDRHGVSGLVLLVLVDVRRRSETYAASPAGYKWPRGWPRASAVDHYRPRLGLC